MERIDEEGPKTLKDASVRELLDECDRKLGPLPPREPTRTVEFVPVFVPVVVFR